MKLTRMLAVHYDEIESDPHTLFNIDTPEKYLLYSMLCRAIEDFIFPKKTTKRVSIEATRLSDEAYAWLKNKVDRSTGSIYWVLLNISSNPESAQTCLLKALNDPARMIALLNARIGYRPSGNAT